jgi:hypothetical protein
MDNTNIEQDVSENDDHVRRFLTRGARYTTAGSMGSMERGAPSIRPGKTVTIGRAVRLVMHSDGRIRLPCESCTSLSKKRGQIEHPPMTILPLPPANSLGFENGEVHLLGPKVECQWCRDIPKRQKAREEEEAQRISKRPRGARRTFVDETLKEVEQKLEGE